MDRLNPELLKWKVAAVEAYRRRAIAHVRRTDQQIHHNEGVVSQNNETYERMRGRWANQSQQQ